MGKVLMTAGILLAVAGSVWMLQGLNVLPGSVMSGQSFWAGAGFVTLVVGVVATVWGARRGAAGKKR